MNLVLILPSTCMVKSSETAYKNPLGAVTKHKVFSEDVAKQTEVDECNMVLKTLA